MKNLHCHRNVSNTTDAVDKFQNDMNMKNVFIKSSWTSNTVIRVNTTKIWGGSTCNIFIIKKFNYDFLKYWLTALLDTKADRFYILFSKSEFVLASVIWIFHYYCLICYNINIFILCKIKNLFKWNVCLLWHTFKVDCTQHFTSNENFPAQSTANLSPQARVSDINLVYEQREIILAKGFIRLCDNIVEIFLRLK